MGITGGIATGKSSVTKLLSEFIPSTVFDADDYSRKLLTQDPEVQSEVRQHFGGNAFTADGTPNRPFLRDLVFNDPAKLKVLEGILHPRIRECWTRLAAVAKNGDDWLMVDIPLLFETDAASFFTKIVVVGCSLENQIRRLVELRNLSREIASKIIGAQFELRLKMGKAEHVIWNEGSLSCLEEQTILLARALSVKAG